VWLTLLNHKAIFSFCCRCAFHWTLVSLWSLLVFLNESYTFSLLRKWLCKHIHKVRHTHSISLVRPFQQNQFLVSIVYNSSAVICKKTHPPTFLHCDFQHPLGFLFWYLQKKVFLIIWTIYFHPFRLFFFDCHWQGKRVDIFCAINFEKKKGCLCERWLCLLITAWLTLTYYSWLHGYNNLPANKLS